MDPVAKFNALIGKAVGPNAVHAIDGMVAYLITGIVTYAADPSVRNYAANHPALVVVSALGVPALTALASRFRKAATPLKAAPAVIPAAGATVTPITPPETPAA